MQRLDHDEFEDTATEYDRAVAADPAIDAFCSRSAWVLSFVEAFRPGAELHVARDGDAFVVLAEIDEPAIGPMLQPLESMWGFASPLVGEASASLLACVLAEAAANGDARPILLTGVPVARARLEPVIRAFSIRYALRPLAPTQRYQASLEGGFEGWLARRARPFRHNLRAARQRTLAAGVSFECMQPRDDTGTAEAYARVLSVERDTWKTASGNGVDRGPMRDFYARMLPRLAERSELRVLFATRDGVDLGYLHGGVAGGLFRGLQFSYREGARALGLGNVLQAEMLERLCAEGLRCYDLGAQSEYKRHWGEAGLETIGLLARPR